MKEESERLLPILSAVLEIVREDEARKGAVDDLLISEKGFLTKKNLNWENKTTRDSISYLEVAVDDSTDQEKEEEEINISYGFQEEEFFARLLYDSAPLDYVKLFYGGTAKKTFSFETEDEYWTETPVVDVESDALTTQQAHEAFFEIQYTAAAGAWTEINLDKKRRFDMWLKVNSAMGAAIHTLYAFTGDVNYSA